MKRILMFSASGGVGRTTTTYAIARMLANWGRRVLVIDVDLDSPGSTTAFVEPDKLPRYGVVDWLVDQPAEIEMDMVASPAWTAKLPGKIDVVPAYGHKTQDYLTKLMRVHANEAWADRFADLASRLEAAICPDVTLIDGPSGLWGASLVPSLDATVWMF
ncbi:ParA family protein [Alicyclobacillus acidocaldarius]|uniref:AAA domain-containing protein n=1 Tax=Alicyclobacillus acidocaldarius (strain Tc-4-1) TaxID=1048834 RepID=F8IH23_ALIAT|nr:AAA family ATPase [Alicyclobacillus acidocaldarius]AEJ44377.1 hypothetical protein TC41_2478 [Alicyclobacillus acidocaldarius subsp. acidocaldarius Tc-4-1]